MKTHGNVDATFRVLGSLGRYQMLQILVNSLGSFGAAYQLLGNIFIGTNVKWHQCSAPNNNSVIPPSLQYIDWNSSHVTYDQCEIIVSAHNRSGSSQQYSCLFGYDYDFRTELSFRTEFDLVCDWKLLGGLAQSFLILGQGFGAVMASWFSDRFGRKKVLVTSQLGLMTVGMATGFAPSYAVLAVFKFLLGGFQQGVVTTCTTLAVELFPAERRSLQCMLGSALWGFSASSMALFAFLLRDHPWRHLQFVLSIVSAVGFLQLWYLDESLRWLLANGKRKDAMKVLTRAARVNHKDLSTVLQTLDHTPTEQELETTSSANGEEDHDMEMSSPTAHSLSPVKNTLDRESFHRLTLMDLIRHKRLLCNAVVMWIAWFTCAFAFFALYMMSSSLHGNRFLNYFLTALMEVPPGFLFFFLVDRVGRKWATRPMFILAGFGLLSSGIFRYFSGSGSALKTLSVVSAMVGMFGSSGMFGALYFYTPEIFPTNIRNQALGVASFAGRCGGMLAPFMTSLADIAVWAPGALIGSLCFFVVFIIYILPETKGRELPHTLEDIEQWHHAQKKTNGSAASQENTGDTTRL